MRVLLAENDQITAGVIANALTQQNYVVDIATDDQLSWQFVKAVDYNLIVLNVVLPKLNGIDFCRQLRRERYQMPILLLMAQNKIADRVVGLDAGADDYIVKPFDLQELMARIRALLRRGSSSLLPAIEWGDLRLDPSSCEVTYGGKPLRLTPKEYSLMKLFLCNRDRVFSRGAILDYLWTFDDPPEEETVKSHIKSLRRKFKEIRADADLIETIYGLGYRLKPLSHKQQNQALAAAELKEGRTQQQFTLLMHQREWVHVFDHYLHLAKRDDQPLYLVILELINFGQIQQQYGDTAGDTIMQQVEQCLRWMFRSSDIIDRWSDSAFVMGIYGMTKRNGERRLAEVLKVLNQKGFTGPNGTPLRLSFRTGTAEYSQDGDDWQTLCQTASTALSQI